MSERWIRSQRAAVADAGDALLLIARDASVRRLDDDSAELARVVLAYLAQPRSESDVIAHVESLAGPLGERRDVVRDLLRVLASSGAIAAAPSNDEATTPTAAAARTPSLRVVVGVTGAIAATHAPALVAALQRRGHTVEVALTMTAQRFVSVDALGAIANREVHTSLWPSTPHAPAPHIALANWADLVVVYPASATTIGRIANGDFSDLVSAIALATRGAVVLAPSMNLAMLEAPAVQRNLELLREDGVVALHGVPSYEVAEAPATRSHVAGAAPAPSDVVAAIDALQGADALPRRSPPSSSSAWDVAYRAAADGQTRTDGLPLLPWVRNTCDDDIAAELATLQPVPSRPLHDSGGVHERDAAVGPRQLLDVGCGLGQVARHAAGLGFRVTATDLSETALVSARDALSRDLAITWLRDDVCASALVSQFDVIVDRATLHTLPRARVHAWAATMRRLLAPGGTLIVKAHRDGVAGATSGWSADAVRAYLPDFELVAARDAELPGLATPAPIPSLLFVLHRPA